MSALNVELNRQLSREAGVSRDGDDWFKAYTYHLGAVVEPLPFERFKSKLQTLNRLLRLDPNGAVEIYSKQINTLSRELGY